MASGDIGAVLKGVETLFSTRTVAGLTDLQLLERFAGRGDDGAEAAFATLVKWHGPMVLRVCRGELQDLHAAEDAFQATFLILARKARSIRKGGSLASWLYGVARRVARRARVDRARRAACQRRGALMADNPVLMAYDPPELVPEIQEEVDRLPEKYRTPIILCYLEGLTHEEAASQLSIPVGTVKVRLSRGRERLRGRLVRRGLAPALIASALSASTRGAIPLPLLDITVTAAMQVAAVRAAGVSVAVAALVEGVLRAMFLAKLRTIAALMAASLTMVLTSLFLVAALSPTVRSDQDSASAEVRNPLPPPIQTPDNPQGARGVIVKKSVFHRTTSQPGTVLAFNHVELYPSVSGVLNRLHVDIGAVVKKGDVLATVHAPELRFEQAKAEAQMNQVQARAKTAESRVRVAQAALNTSKAQIEVAEAELEQAEAAESYREKQLVRLTDLVARKAVEERLAAEEADRMRTARALSHAAKIKVKLEKAGLETAEAKLDMAKAEALETRSEFGLVQTDLEKARMALDSCEVRSPIDGIVTRRNYDIGAFARAAATGGSVPLFSIDQANVVRIVVPVPDRDALYLDPGDPATFRAHALGDREYRGKIARTSFAEDARDQTLRAEIDLDNADGRLRPGQFGRVTINLEDHPRATPPSR